MPGASDISQKRALFYVFDGGTGIGHLRRLSRIARRLQGRLACLLVTGHRAAANWFVPEECEYVHLPSWDSLFEAKARYWGRRPFLSLDKRDAVRLRREILGGIVRGFKPDAIFVDHLPLGAEEELTPILKKARCRKYLVTRGVQNETEDLDRLVLGGKAFEYLRSHYDRIFAAADPRVFDFTRQYGITPDVSEKTVHTGYVTVEILPGTIAQTRAARGLADGDIWVVASAGGGQLGEQLLEGCVALAARHPDVAFDIVLGPRSNLEWDQFRHVSGQGRLRVHKDVPDMACFHAGADLVISSGGYNSLLEALQGTADILCFPLRKDRRDEQYQHAVRLKQFVDIEVSTDLGDLPALFDRAMAKLASPRLGDRRAELDFAGAANIERIVLADLGCGD